MDYKIGVIFQSLYYPLAFFGVLRTFFAKKVLSRRRQNPLKNETLTVFIRSDTHVVRAGFKAKGCGPALYNPRGFLTVWRFNY